MEKDLLERMKPFLEDEEILSERFAGRMDLWEKCVRMFPKEDLVPSMDEALFNKDMESFRGFVHRLKGNLANFGFEKAAKKASMLMEMLLRETPDLSLVQKGYSEFREGYCQILKEIKVSK